MVKTLLDVGADATICSVRGESPLHIAVRCALFTSNQLYVTILFELIYSNMVCEYHFYLISARQLLSLPDRKAARGARGERSRTPRVSAHSERGGRGVLALVSTVSRLQAPVHCSPFSVHCMYKCAHLQEGETTVHYACEYARAQPHYEFEHVDMIRFLLRFDGELTAHTKHVRVYCFRNVRVRKSKSVADDSTGATPLTAFPLAQLHWQHFHWRHCIV